jgi:ribonucleoside-triphosphate reductase
MVADVVVVGGVRRSAMISLSDLGSEPMAKAKSGSWWEGHVYRQLSNNSAVYNGKPDVGEFLKNGNLCMTPKVEKEVSSIETLLERSLRSLENAIRTLTLALTHAAKLSLDPSSFATLQKLLSELETQMTTLEGKLELATILGTIQSTFTDFRYLRKVWQKNTEEERLLGVSLTGIADNPRALHL